jgi:hypothetical protein
MVRCVCGQQFEVTGLDRHRVYWLEGAHESDPVIGQQCPVCEAPLPSERDAPAAAASR